MRWDDLEILNLVDQFEETETGSLINGLALMQRIGSGRVLDPHQDYGTFARELLLARDGGYVTFADEDAYRTPPDPVGDPNLWLQHIRDIRLTLAGRDRARGRAVLKPLPSPDEDDDRPIAGMTLEDVSRAIGDAYTGSQLPKFLRDSGIPVEFIPSPPTGSKWEYVMEVLEGLHDGGSDARRVLRSFIGKWLTNRLHTWPKDDARQRVIANLAQQGWHIRDDILVIGDQRTAEPGALLPLGRDERIAALHATVRQAAERYLDSGHMEVAIFEAFKAVNNRVKAMTGLGADGSDLMAKAFSDVNPPICLADLSTESGRNIQAGFRFLFMGAVRGIRNPNAHELFQPLGEEEAHERLGLASMLMRRLDEATVTR